MSCTKSSCTAILENMLSQDERKRLTAISKIKTVAEIFGPERVKNQLIPFLHQFMDDDPNICLAVLKELNDFSEYIGGVDNEKYILPLLIGYCTMDEKQIADSSVKIIKEILDNNLGLYLQTIKILINSKVNTAIECGVMLITKGLPKLMHLKQQFLEIFKKLIKSQNATLRIIAAKYFTSMIKYCKEHRQILQIIEMIYLDTQDLPKLFSIQALLILYANDPLFVVKKFKQLTLMNTWRINIKLCQSGSQIASVFSQAHYKTVMEPAFIKMMISEDSEVKAAACLMLPTVCRKLSEKQNQLLILPIIQKLYNNQNEEVRLAFASSIVKVFPYFEDGIIKTAILPLVLEMMREKKLELSSQILSGFKQLSKHLKPEKFDEFFIQEIKNQLQTRDWRLKIRTLAILGSSLLKANFLSPSILELLFSEIKGSVEATRHKASQVICEIIKSSSQEWLDGYILPKLLQIKQCPNYLIRRQIIFIIEQTWANVSSKMKKQYQNIVLDMLSDKTPNIRLLTLKSISSKRQMFSSLAIDKIKKCQYDQDAEICQYYNTTCLN